ncbi:hypothetical protein B0H13DRAFT_2040233, partial [Mycena leptocephala]
MCRAHMYLLHTPPYVLCDCNVALNTLYRSRRCATPTRSTPSRRTTSRTRSIRHWRFCLQTSPSPRPCAPRFSSAHPTSQPMPATRRKSRCAPPAPYPAPTASIPLQPSRFRRPSRQSDLPLPKSASTRSTLRCGSAAFPSATRSTTRSASICSCRSQSPATRYSRPRAPRLSAAAYPPQCMMHGLSHEAHHRRAQQLRRPFCIADTAFAASRTLWRFSVPPHPPLVAPSRYVFCVLPTARSHPRKLRQAQPSPCCIHDTTPSRSTTCMRSTHAGRPPSRRHLAHPPARLYHPHAPSYLTAPIAHRCTHAQLDPCLFVVAHASAVSCHPSRPYQARRCGCGRAAGAREPSETRARYGECLRARR